MTASEIADLELGLATILAVALRIEQKVSRIERRVVAIEANLARQADT
jgi:hypothetical protein